MGTAFKDALNLALEGQPSCSHFTETVGRKSQNKELTDIQSLKALVLGWRKTDKVDARAV